MPSIPHERLVRGVFSAFNLAAGFFVVAAEDFADGFFAALLSLAVIRVTFVEFSFLATVLDSPKLNSLLASRLSSITIHHRGVEVNDTIGTCSYIYS